MVHKILFNITTCVSKRGRQSTHNEGLGLPWVMSSGTAAQKNPSAILLKKNFVEKKKTLTDWNVILIPFHRNKASTWLVKKGFIPYNALLHSVTPQPLLLFKAASQLIRFALLSCFPKKWIDYIK